MLAIPVAVQTRARRPADAPHRLTDAAELLTGGAALIERSMAAVAAACATGDRTAESPCDTTPALPQPGPLPGADNAVAERLLAERRLASC